MADIQLMVFGGMGWDIWLLLVSGKLLYCPTFGDESMLKSIENLLILQDWDKKLVQHQGDLKSLAPHKAFLNEKLLKTQAAIKSAQENVQSKTSAQKQLELEIESYQEKIRKYANQQLQTKKNDEYQALEKEMAHCREVIARTEDKMIEVMEEIEAAQHQLVEARKTSEALSASVKTEIDETNKREAYLTRTIAEYIQKRDQQRSSVEEEALQLYDRLFIRKPGSVLVGIERGICGGCHMKMTMHSVITARGGAEISTCSNCGRILFYLPGMELPPGMS